MSVLARGALAAMVLVAPLTGVVRAENLDAGKNGPALFAASCVACHRGPQGLARDRSARALAGFLLQHYTSGPNTASELAGYLVTPNIARGRPAKPSQEASQAGLGRPADAAGEAGESPPRLIGHRKRRPSEAAGQQRAGRPTPGDPSVAGDAAREARAQTAATDSPAAKPAEPPKPPPPDQPAFDAPAP